MLTLKFQIESKYHSGDAIVATSIFCIQSVDQKRFFCHVKLVEAYRAVILFPGCIHLINPHLHSETSVCVVCRERGTILINWYPKLLSGISDQQV